MSQTILTLSLTRVDTKTKTSASWLWSGFKRIFISITVVLLSLEDNIIQ